MIWYRSLIEQKYITIVYPPPQMQWDRSSKKDDQLKQQKNKGKDMGGVNTAQDELLYMPYISAVYNGKKTTICLFTVATNIMIITA